MTSFQNIDWRIGIHIKKHAELIYFLLLLSFLLLSGLMLFPGKKCHNSGHQPVVLGIVAFFSFHILHFPYYSRGSK